MRFALLLLVIAASTEAARSETIVRPASLIDDETLEIDVEFFAMLQPLAASRAHIAFALPLESAAFPRGAKRAHRPGA